MIEYLIYIISISFQVTGALMLVIYGISTKREALIKKIAGNGLIYRDEDEITYNETAFFNVCKMTYIERLSFVYILIGYLSGVFGNIDRSLQYKIIALMSIAVLSFALMFFSNKGVELYIQKKNKAFKITNDELKKIGKEPDIESVSKSSIDEICN